jgi:hypothetical protein
MIWALTMMKWQSPFVAHVVVAGRQIERVFQVRHLLVEPRRRFGVELGNRRDRMHQVSHIGDEG